MISPKKYLAAAGLAAAATLMAGSAALAGDPNAGDIWVDTATTQTTGVTAAGPGHENDPHLPCANVGVFGAKMADPTATEPNTFTIFAWPPTGSQQQIYQANWTYTQGAPDPQEIAVVPVSVFGAGGHFKIQVTQDPVKQKVFWIDCSGAVSGGSTPPPSPAAESTPTPSPTAVTGSSPSPSPSGSVSGEVSGGTTSGGTVPTGGTGAVEAAVATASGAVLATTGLPFIIPIVGFLLLLVGASVQLVRRRLA